LANDPYEEKSLASPCACPVISRWSSWAAGRRLCRSTVHSHWNYNKFKADKSQKNKSLNEEMFTLILAGNFFLNGSFINVN